jgi:hypothetical protein
VQKRLNGIKGRLLGISGGISIMTVFVCSDEWEVSLFQSFSAHGSQVQMFTSSRVSLFNEGGSMF